MNTMITGVMSPRVYIAIVASAILMFSSIAMTRLLAVVPSASAMSAGPSASATFPGKFRGIVSWRSTEKFSIVDSYGNTKTFVIDPATDVAVTRSDETIKLSDLRTYDYVRVESLGQKVISIEVSR